MSYSIADEKKPIIQFESKMNKNVLTEVTCYRPQIKPKYATCEYR